MSYLKENWLKIKEQLLRGTFIPQPVRRVEIPKPGGGGYMHRQYVASFIGGAPASDPQIVALVTIRQPDPKIAYYGGTVAAPAVKQILASTLDYLGVRKTTSQPRSYNSSN